MNKINKLIMRMCLDFTRPGIYKFLSIQKILEKETNSISPMITTLGDLNSQS